MQRSPRREERSPKSLDRRKSPPELCRPEQQVSGIQLIYEYIWRILTRADVAESWTDSMQRNARISASTLAQAAIVTRCIPLKWTTTSCYLQCSSEPSSALRCNAFSWCMSRMNAGYFLIQLASEKDKEKVYREIGQTIRKDAKGVKQVFISPQFICLGQYKNNCRSHSLVSSTPSTRLSRPSSKSAQIL